RWFIIIAISVFLYTVLKPYGLQSIGITAAVASIAGIVFSLGQNTYKMLTAPRSEPLSKPKMILSGLIFGGVLAAVLFVPVPWFFEAPYLVEPHEVRDVYVSTPGRLMEVNVQPGDRVSKGDLLVRLTNIEKEDQYRALLVQKAAQLKWVDTYYHLKDDAQEQLALKKLFSLEQQIQDYEKQLARLTVYAPIDGVVVPPPRTPEPTLQAARTQLATWHGSPLDPRNRGAFLEERTHLLSIAPDADDRGGPDQYRAVLVVDQSDRNDVFVGQRVRLKFNHLPNKVYEGRVEEISERHLEFAPESLSNKYQGDLSTVSDSEGRERLVSIAYQATVVLDEDPGLMMTGLRGKARFFIDDYSAGQMLWRYLRRTFHFRL
ncbi:MAG: efflux RND transporter periplasmic adaptor subunit, partial [Planctomycetaceae bacterium]